MSQIEDYRDMARGKEKPHESNKRPTSVDIIKPEVNEKISEMAVIKGTSTRKYVNDLLEMHVEKEDFLTEYLPQIKKIGFDENLGEIYLRDSKISKSPTISLPNGYIECDTCDDKFRKSCVHVMYAMTQPEIGRLSFTRKKK